MFRGYKIVKKELKKYKIAQRESFFNKRRFLKVLFESFKSSIISFLIIIITVILFFKPVNKEPNSFQILYNQIFALIILTLFSGFIIITFYRNLSSEYFEFFETSSNNFNRYIKYILSFIFIVIVVIIINVQNFYVSKYLSPSLETCTFYDWYGNKIYQPDKIGTCPKLINIEAEKDKKIKFGVISNENFYSEYEYIYENDQLLSREIITYQVTKDKIEHINEIDLEKEPVYNKDLIENEYLETKFSSKHTNLSYNVDGTIKENMINIINAQGVEDEIVVSLNDREIYRLNKLGDNKDLYVSHELYYLKKWSNGSVNESYYNQFTYQNGFEVKYIEYDLDIRVTYHKTPFVKNMVVNKTFHRFEMNINTVRTKIVSLDHYIDDELLYKDIFSYTDYGYKVKHYSYYRDTWGRIIESKERYSRTYCYASDDNINHNDFDYSNISDSEVNTYCTVPLFYVDNPLILEDYE